jgi:hypothetical protein
MIKKLALASLVAMSTVASAGQIYRCQQADGSVAFSDKRCGDKVEELDSDALSNRTRGLGGITTGEAAILGRSQKTEAAAKIRREAQTDELIRQGKRRQEENKVKPPRDRTRYQTFIPGYDD